jgi:putative transposon-encoded protein
MKIHWTMEKKELFGGGIECKIPKDYYGKKKK